MSTNKQPISVNVTFFKNPEVFQKVHGWRRVCVSSIRSWTCHCPPTWRRTTSTSSRPSRRSAWGWRSWRWTSTSDRSRRTTRVRVRLTRHNKTIKTALGKIEQKVSFFPKTEMMQSLAQRPAPANTNRERRPRYQHPKGAPNADLIFKTGGRWAADYTFRRRTGVWLDWWRNINSRLPQKQCFCCPSWTPLSLRELPVFIFL